MVSETHFSFTALYCTEAVPSGQEYKVANKEDTTNDQPRPVQLYQTSELSSKTRRYARITRFATIPPMADNNSQLEREREKKKLSIPTLTPRPILFLNIRISGVFFNPKKTSFIIRITLSLARQ